MWAVRLDVDAGALARLTRLLAPDEIARASRYRRPLDRARFVAGRAQLREILGESLGEPAESLRFSYSATGKPSLETTRHVSRLEFNASGSDGLGLVALRQGAAVGVDVERLRELPGRNQLAARLLAADELAAFTRLPEAGRERHFFDAWVRKEALGKLRGTGLRASMHDGPAANEWIAALALPEPGFAAAIASPQPIGDLDVRWWLPTA